MSSIPSSALGTATTASQASMECRWDNCGSTHSDACSLLAHVAEVHIGRRSRQNLSLVCKWPDCSRSSQPFAKRDHIISHMRVHIHYKPFYCELCFKMFKRPQDLKKHLGIHAASKTSIGKEHVCFQQTKQFPTTSVSSGAGYLDAFNMSARGTNSSLLSRTMFDSRLSAFSNVSNGSAPFDAYFGQSKSTGSMAGRPNFRPRYVNSNLQGLSDLHIAAQSYDMQTSLAFQDQSMSSMLGQSSPEGQFEQFNHQSQQSQQQMQMHLQSLQNVQAMSRHLAKDNTTLPLIFSPFALAQRSGEGASTLADAGVPGAPSSNGAVAVPAAMYQMQDSLSTLHPLPKFYLDSVSAYDMARFNMSGFSSLLSKIQASCTGDLSDVRGSVVASVGDSRGRGAIIGTILQMFHFLGRSVVPSAAFIARQGRCLFGRYQPL